MKPTQSTKLAQAAHPVKPSGECEKVHLKTKGRPGVGCEILIRSQGETGGWESGTSSEHPAPPAPNGAAGAGTGKNLTRRIPLLFAAVVTQVQAQQT